MILKQSFSIIKVKDLLALGTVWSNILKRERNFKSLLTSVQKYIHNKFIGVYLAKDEWFSMLWAK